MTQAHAPEKSEGGRRLLIAVEDEDLQEVGAGIGLNYGAIRRQAVVARAGDDLAVAHLNHLDLRASGRNRQLLGGDGRRPEMVDRRDLPGLEEGLAPVGDLFAVNPGGADLHALKTLDEDEVGGIARLQEADPEAVVANRVDAGALEDVKEIVAQAEGLPYQEVDVAAGEIDRFEVVGAEHAPTAVAGDEGMEVVEVAGAGALAQLDLHPQGQLFVALCEADRFVIGADPRPDVGRKIRAAQAGGVAVDPFAHCGRSLYLGHDLRVVEDDAGEVHHLGEKVDIVALQQLCDIGSRQHGPGVFKGGGWDAGGRTKIKLQRRLPAACDHKVDSRHPDNIGDLVGIGHHGHGSVGDGLGGEGCRGQHRAFNVDMGIDQTRQDKGAGNPGVRLDCNNVPLINDQGSRKLPAGHRVNNDAGYFFHRFSSGDDNGCYG